MAQLIEAQQSAVGERSAILPESYCRARAARRPVNYIGGPPPPAAL